MMRRSPIKPGTAPMKRTAFARGERIEAREVTKTITKAARGRSLRTKGPKMTPIRKAARGQDCTIVLPGVCNRDPATSVLCHSNELADGKGMGLKAPDTAAAIGCSACHDVLDGRRPRPAWLTKDMVLAAFRGGIERTHQFLRTKGLIE
ncbi:MULTISPECIES: nuclease domain-containing protein [unclassified Duganella]|uniref:nuclease domain-containing protein n=1 Tax=unclassified Duganella TaxID=2636909 RepID=UPI0008830972|nr:MULTISPECIES: nuclease domain-containing protein [unclassified Duganella]SDF80681.1 Protein of unknown function [Duganella sp. OV458]SDI48630.1 Protein of unknown function [Duganella sp. OV510]